MRRWRARRHQWEYHKRILELREMFPGEEVAPVCGAYRYAAPTVPDLQKYYGVLCTCHRLWESPG